MPFLESVVLTESQKPQGDHFHIKIFFGITKEEAIKLMPKLSKWHQVLCVDDPVLYEKALETAVLNFVPIPGSSDFKVEFSSMPENSSKLAWTNGLDIFHTEGNGRHLVFSEYVKDTQVTRAIVNELHKIASDANSPYQNLDNGSSYIEPLLTCLYMHWD